MMRYLSILVLAAMLGVSSGCALLPDITHEPQFHNPFPQLYRVAVLPFGNQSKEPTVDGEAVALAYYNELQVIRGFEVMPVPVVKRLLEASKFQPNGPGDFQKLARFMGVDAVVVGSITEYTPYYPPRMGLAVNWYAANPNFHPIPAGYGLPWGTTQEQDIPEDLVFEAEFALARRQLETQTPEIVAPLPAAHPASHTAPLKDAAKTAKNAEKSGSNAAIKAARLDELPTPAMLPRGASAVTAGGDVIAPLPGEVALPPALPELPADWPDPRGFIPPPPSLTRPEGTPQTEPVITHTRVYHGSDPDFTNKLEKYYYYRDDARFGGWQSYLQRSDDFTRFCCHLHITEMLAARGGVGKPRVVYRWPISRYER